MKLRDRRYHLVFNHLREYLLDSEKDVGVVITRTEIHNALKARFPDLSSEEITYGVRHLAAKGFLEATDMSDYTLTQTGIDQWIFPMEGIDPKKVFLSYAIEDKVLAGKIKKGLEPDFFVFVAHDDINGGAEWKDVIISNLKNSTAFLALRTESYAKKSATEQESGFALALDKRIITLGVGTSLSDAGFCSHLQGHKFEISPDPAEKIIAYCRKQLLPEENDVSS